MPSLLPRNMLLIARREYLEKIRGRAFRISTILVPMLLLFLFGVSAFTGRKMAARRHIAIAADNASLAADIRSDLTQEKRAGYTVGLVAPFTAQDRADLQARVENKSLDGLLIIENSSTSTPSVTYIAQSSGDLMNTSRLEDAINHGFLDLRPAQQGVPQQQIHSLADPVHLQTLQMTGSGQTGKSQGMTPFYKTMLMTFLMTMPILLYGMDMARSIVEEKSSRIFEVMLAVARLVDRKPHHVVGVDQRHGEEPGFAAVAGGPPGSVGIGGGRVGLEPVGGVPGDDRVEVHPGAGPAHEVPVVAVPVGETVGLHVRGGGGGEVPLADVGGPVPPALQQ